MQFDESRSGQMGISSFVRDVDVSMCPCRVFDSNCESHPLRFDWVACGLCGWIEIAKINCSENWCAWSVENVRDLWIRRLHRPYVRKRWSLFLSHILSPYLALSLPPFLALPSTQTHSHACILARQKQIFIISWTANRPLITHHKMPKIKWTSSNNARLHINK